jgi:hypothetical protein
VIEMDVKQLLIDTVFNHFHYPVYQQGSMSDSEKYPDSFFTFFNNETNDDRFFDNQETVTIWDFDLNIYSVDPEVVNGTLREAKQLLKAAGFIVNGLGYDVLSDEETHTGRGINVLYIEKVR